ncbi:hypothetical protein OAN93_02440 [Candidatus Marinimicrobia bacterium]|nr:hypothetical protein [Candidatus Neomarinimicrobiota bacterium]
MSSNLTFPHPVLGVRDDFNSSSVFKLDVSHNLSSEGKIVLNISPNLKNDSIVEMINSNIASLYFLVSCPGTLFSEVYEFNGFSKLAIEINQDRLWGRVNTSAKVVMNVDSDITLSDVNEYYYKGYTFYLNKGEILAMSSIYKFDHYPEYVEDTPIQSDTFWHLQMYSGDKEESHYELSDNGVIINVIESEYRKFEMLEAEGMNEALKMLYIFPVLMELLRLHFGDPETREVIASKGWYSKLVETIEKYDISGSSIFEDAQVIMKKAMDKQRYEIALKSIVDRMEDE